MALRLLQFGYRLDTWSCPTDAEKGGSLVVGDFEIAAKYGEWQLCLPR